MAAAAASAAESGAAAATFAADGEAERKDTGVTAAAATAAAADGGAAAAASAGVGEAARKIPEVKEYFVPKRVQAALDKSKEFKQFQDERVFRMLHMFAGPKDALGDAIKEECDKRGLKFHAIALDRKIDPGLDLSTTNSKVELESDIKQGEFDYVHGGFPCGSFSRARWQPGGPPPVRSAEELHGLSANTEAQQREADRGTVMANNTTYLVRCHTDTCRSRGTPSLGTIENPPGDEVAGSAWALPDVKKELELMGAETVEFNTCAWQEDKVRWFKPAKWGGALEGLKSLSRVCRCPNWVTHETLKGKQRTEAAGAYPKLLCQKVAQLVVAQFKRTLSLEWWRNQVKLKGDEVSELQRKWLLNEEKRRAREAQRMTKSKEEDKTMSAPTVKRTLTSALEGDNVDQDNLPGPSGKKSKKEVREEENINAIGGMRNPDVAVERLFQVRQVGRKLRAEWEKFAKEFPDAMDVAAAYGSDRAKHDPELVKEWKKRMLVVLGGVREFEGIRLKDKVEYVSPLDPDMWHAWQCETRDPDTCLRLFIREGVPLGMSESIPSSGGIFPEVRDKPNDPEDPLPELEFVKDLRNYVSVREQPEEASIEVDRYKSRGYVREVPFTEAQTRFGTGVVSKLALIVKTKADGAIKRRIIIDLRRSGGNDRCVVNERLILPRMSDVLRCLRKMHWLESRLVEEMRAQGDYEEIESELFLIDFTDAVCHFGVHANELKNCLSPAVEEGKESYLLWVALLFGFKAAPLLMARLSSAVGRLAQSMLEPQEAMTQIYVDDYLLMTKGTKKHREKLLAMVLHTLLAFGMMISLGKGERGTRLTWIGASIELTSNEVKFGVPVKMCDEVLEKITAWPGKGMMSLKELRSVTGKLSWMAGIVHRLRWAVSVMYAVITDVQQDLRDNTEEGRAKRRKGDQREKPQLVHVKRLGSVLPWLIEMVRRCRERSTIRVEPLEEPEVNYGIVTDASPFGVGAVLLQRKKNSDQLMIVEAAEGLISHDEARLLQQDFGEASSQAVMETFAVLKAVKKWQTKLRGQALLIRSDSTVALSMLRRFSSPTVALNYLGAELSLLLESLEIPALRLQHLPGKFNQEADWLSRQIERGDIPSSLQGVKIAKLKTWEVSDFSLPPPGTEVSKTERPAWQGTPFHHQTVWDCVG